MESSIKKEGMNIQLLNTFVNGFFEAKSTAMGLFSGFSGLVVLQITAPQIDLWSKIFIAIFAALIIPAVRAIIEVVKTKQEIRHRNEKHQQEMQNLKMEKLQTTISFLMEQGVIKKGMELEEVFELAAKHANKF